jgi:2-polyprenyl-6-hydroxyphenyl methylase/3-demethylubiquinone-9 3-methyltransferase
MQMDVYHKLSKLPRLDVQNARASDIPCKICGSPSAFFDVVDFNKTTDSYVFGPSGVLVNWYRCRSCGFLFTTFFDDWSADDFFRFVYNEDYIRVDPEYSGQRPQRVLCGLLSGLLKESAPMKNIRVLDYGAGSGILVRGLVEHGYNAVGYDPYSSPKRPEGRFDLITCFEVIEHAPDPIAAFREMTAFLKDDGSIFLSQSLQPRNIEAIRANWWYCAPRNGHCSTFTDRSLLHVGEHIGMCFHRGEFSHAFTRPEGGVIADALGRLIGPPLTSITLGAPATPHTVGWNEIERSPNGAFRWTASPSVAWNATVSAGGRLDIRIPVQNAIYQEFPAQCRIVVDGQEMKTETRNGELFCELAEPVSAGRTVAVELRTPAPRSPRDLRGAPDDRLLGLAIPLA